MNNLMEKIPLSLDLCPQSPTIKNPLWHQINCVWLKRRNVLFYRLLWEAEKG